MSETPNFSQELPNEEATVALAMRLATRLQAGDLLVLTGPLGAGKTFFVGALCRALGLDEDEPVPSPTFTLVHEYSTQPPISHADLYRLRSVEDVRELDLIGRRDQGQLVVVEWGAAYLAALGGDAIELEFSVFPRRARIAGSGVRAAALVASLARGVTP